MTSNGTIVNDNDIRVDLYMFGFKDVYGHAHRCLQVMWDCVPWQKSGGSVLRAIEYGASKVARGECDSYHVVHGQL